MRDVRNVLVVLAAGMGVRFGADRPKQYVEIGGRRLLDWTMKEMAKSRKADAILLVLNDDEHRLSEAERRYGVKAIVGGSDRAHSFQNAIDHLAVCSPLCEKVVFHEGARPLLEASVIDRYFDLLDEYDCVETCTAIVDSLGSYTMRAPRREDFYLIQAPEAYRFETLRRYYDCESEVYFAGNQLPDSCTKYRCFDVRDNYKVTTQEDLALVETLLQRRR